MSTLDKDKFRKVCSLMKEGATEGERAAAKARAEAMAKKAGLTLKQALSNLDNAHDVTPKPSTFNIFEGWDEWMEEREPGYKARKAAEQAEREASDAIRRNELLERYGSQAAIFARTDREWLLFEAARPFADEIEEWTDEDSGLSHPYVTGLAGKSDFYNIEDVPKPLAEAVCTAYSMPVTLVEAFAEYQAWDTLERERALFSGGEWNHYHEVLARVAILRHALRTWPARTWDDIDARMQWWERDLYYGGTSNPELERQRKDRITADLAALRSQHEQPLAQPVHRTNASRAEAVKALLLANPSLTDREIARQAGVSPQTVNNWRSRLGLRKVAA